MSHRKRNAEALAIKGERFESFAERLGLRHDRKIELALQQHFRKPAGHSLDEGDLATWVGAVKTREKAHKSRRPDSAHDAETDLRLLQA